MTRLHDKVLAFVCGATAIGVACFWATWFYAVANGQAGSACYVAFESMFPPSDFILAGLLLVTARGLWRGALPRTAAALASGMLAALAGLDLGWSGIGVFYTDIDPGQGFIVALSFVLMLWLGLRTLCASHAAEATPPPAQRAIAFGIQLYFVVFTIAYWANHYFGEHGFRDLSACAQTIMGTFFWPDMWLCGAALASGLLLAIGARRGRTVGLHLAGGTFFVTLNVFMFSLLHPRDLGAQCFAYAALSCAYFAIIGGLVYCLRRVDEGSATG